MILTTSSAQNLHILKKIKKIDSEQSPNLHILKKNQKLIHLCQSVPHRVWFFCFFWVYAGLVTFHYLFFCWIFLSICRFGDFSLSFFVFLSICRFERLEVHQTCIYSKKINILMPKVHKTCIYSKKSKMIVKSHLTNPAYTQKNQKKSKTNSSMPVSPT